MSNIQRPVGGSIPDFAHIGGAGLEIWYIANCADCIALSTVTPTANILRAVPFIAPKRGGRLDRLGYNITASVAGSTRIGLYNSTSDSNIYPSSLIVDSGSIANSAAVQTATISQTLVPGRLYWLALVSDVASTYRGVTLGGTTHLLGSDNTFGTALNGSITVAFTYAALPATFTAGAAMLSGVILALYYRFSS